MESTDEEDAATAINSNAVAETNGGGSGSRQTSMDTLPSSTRLLRNLAEKMRRDKLNQHISQLAAIVPIVSMANKRVDKTSILRLSAAYLRIYQNLLSERLDKTSWKPRFLEEDVLTNLLLEAVNGFLLIVSTSGKVIYVSDEIEKTLGHSPVDIIGHSVYNILHPDDVVIMQQNLMVTPENQTERRSFYCHLSERCLSRSDCGKYDLVHVLGHVRIAKPPTMNGSSSSSSNGNELTSMGSAVKEDLLICVVRQMRNQAISEISWMEGFPNEYMTQHSLDGSIISADHRISIITGHLPEEVCGKSAYSYMFEKDIPSATVAHKEFFLNESGSATVFCRLWTRSRKLIYLRTTGKLQENCYSQTIDSFLCVNKLLTEEEGKQELRKFHSRYLPPSENCTITESKQVEEEAEVSRMTTQASTSTHTAILNPDASLSTLMNFLHTSSVDGALIRPSTGFLPASDRARQRSVSVSMSTSTQEPEQKDTGASESILPAASLTGSRRHSTNSLVSEGAATGGRDSWWSNTSTVMEAVCVTSTTPEPDIVEMRDEAGCSGVGGADPVVQSPTAACTLAPILEMNGDGKRKLQSQAGTSVQMQSASTISGRRGPVVITTRQRRMTRHVVRLSSYHTPSPDDVEMLLEHSAQTGSNGTSAVSPVVPCKRRCSTKVALETTPLVPKRGRGRPRQNSC